VNLNDLVSRLDSGEPVRLRVAAGRRWTADELGADHRHSVTPSVPGLSGSDRSAQTASRGRGPVSEGAALQMLMEGGRREVVRVTHTPSTPPGSGGAAVASLDVSRQPERYAVGGGELGAQGISRVDGQGHSSAGTSGVKGRLVAAISDFVDVQVSGAVGAGMRGGFFG